MGFVQIIQISAENFCRNDHRHYDQPSRVHSMEESVVFEFPSSAVSHSKYLVLQKRMDVHKVHRVTKLGEKAWIGPYYYKYPDGQDLFGKLYFTTQTAGTAAGLYGVIRCAMPPQPASVGTKIIRLGKCVVPAVGMAFVFTCVTYYSTILRKKDDEFNHGIGGVAAGILGGLFVPGYKAVSCVSFAVFFGSIAAGVKASHMTPVPESASVKPVHSSYVIRHLDTSLMPEIKGNWTREPAPK